MEKSKIFLIGFMGSGKTKLGKKLAATMNYHFFDLDCLIEANEQKTINEIFENIGEEGFRKLESHFLNTYPFPDQSIIACGGGTPCFFNNMDIINNLGLSIYLNTPQKTLVQRLEKGKYKRPLIKDLSEKELTAFIREKLAVRHSFYQKAHLTIESIDNDPETLKELIYAYKAKTSN